MDTNNKRFCSKNILTWLISSLLLVSQMPAQKKYWVKFKDKNNNPYSLTNPSEFLTQKSMDRRSKYNIPFHITDLPVTPSYINGVSSVQGVNVLFASKWLNGVVITINETVTSYSTAFAQITALPFVGDTDRVRRYKLHLEPVSSADPALPAMRGNGLSEDNSRYGGSRRQINQLNIGCYHESGVTGQGITIAVLDAGFSNVNVGPAFDSLRQRGGIIGTRNFVDGGTNVYLGSNHGTAVLSCLAANVPGVIVGTAPGADYWLLRTEDAATETLSEEYNWIRGAEFADSIGVDLLTTSLGYTEFDDASQNHTISQLNGRTAPMSIAANLASRKGMFVLNAAGNEGQSSWKKIGVPADADSICTVGAVDSLGKIGPFSSMGPTADGRIKPDLSAMGVYTWVSDGVNPPYPGNGTSFATPVLAGAVACFWQMNKSMSNIRLLDSLRKLGSLASAPNNTLGWGIPHFPCPCLLKSDFRYKLEGRYEVSFVNTSKAALASATYTWSFGDGTTSNEVNPRHVYPSSTKPFQVALMANNHLSSVCEDTSDIKEIMPYPNPLLDFDFTAYCDENSIIKIDLMPTLYETVQLEIIDYQGRLVVSQVLSPDNFHAEFNASHLANYAYLIKVKTSKGTKTKKILKK